MSQQGGWRSGRRGELLVVEDLRVHFPGGRSVVRAVDGISFSVRAGERFGLIGESGSGKSTTALALMRLIKPPGRIVSGQAWLEGRELLSLPEEEMRRLRLAEISLISQGAMNSLNPVMRIKHQLLDGMAAHGVGLRAGERKARLAQLLESVGLRPAVAEMYPHQLSGGMKQRVVIAIAISLRPRLLVADEPTSALDVVVQRRVVQTLRRVQEELEASVLLIGHDMGLMAQFADRVAVMRQGKIVEVGEVAQIFRRPEHPYTRLLMESLPSLERRDVFQARLRAEERRREAAAEAAR